MWRIKSISQILDRETKSRRPFLRVFLWMCVGAWKGANWYLLTHECACISVYEWYQWIIIIHVISCCSWGWILMRVRYDADGRIASREHKKFLIKTLFNQLAYMSLFLCRTVTVQNGCEWKAEQIRLKPAARTLSLFRYLFMCASSRFWVDLTNNRSTNN